MSETNLIRVYFSVEELRQLIEICIEHAEEYSATPDDCRSSRIAEKLRSHLPESLGLEAAPQNTVE